MKLTERSYNSKLFRPKPLIHIEGDGSLIVVITSWGQPEHAQKAMDEIVNYVSAARGDVEVTSPFEFLSCLSDQANYLRTSLLIANDLLYRSENKSEYLSGIEVVILMRDKKQLAWAQVGSPHILIKKKNRSLMPFAVDFDLSFEMGSLNSQLAPLPGKLLGVDRSCLISCGDINIENADHILLLASSHLPAALWQQSASHLDLETITRALMSEDVDAPFWAGLIQLDED